MDILENGKYTPNTSAILKQLTDSLLPADGENNERNPYFDVFLRTTDGQSFPANRMILSIRSSYFKNLSFNSTGTEPVLQSTVPLPMNSATLKDILHFVYSGESPLVSSILENLKSNEDPDGLPERLAALVDLATGAMELNLRELRDLSIAVFTEAFNRIPKLGCMIVELAVRHRDGILREFPYADKWHTVLGEIEKYFGIPDVRRLTEDTQNNTWRDAPVHALSIDAMKYLMQNAMPEDWNRGELGVQMFQVLHVWGSGGKLPKSYPGMTPASPKEEEGSCADGENARDAGDEKSAERWEVTQEIVKQLDFVTFSYSFVSQYLEGSPLLMPNALLETYKSLAAELADKVESTKSRSTKEHEHREQYNNLRERIAARSFKCQDCGVHHWAAEVLEDFPEIPK